MTQQAYEQTVKQQEHIEYLLTKEAYELWRRRHYRTIADLEENDMFDTPSFYLKEHGLPLDSIIKGL